MDTVFKIFALIGPFLSAYLVYVLALKGKRKEIDIQKENELNTVLSNLLLVWHFLSRIETVINILNNNNSKSIIPKKYFSIIILKTDYLNDKCFSQLDGSIILLKKYDPIIFYKLDGIGNVFNNIRQKYIMPFFKNPEIELINIGAGTLLYETLDNVEDFLEIVARKINQNILAEVRELIQIHRDNDEQKTIEEINKRYYDLIMQIIPKNNTSKPTFEEFVEEVTNSSEFKEMIDLQLNIALNETLPEYLDLIAKNPNITMEQIQKELKINLNNKE